MKILTTFLEAGFDWLIVYNLMYNIIYYYVGGKEFTLGIDYNSVSD